MKVKLLILLAALALAGCQSTRTERIGNFLITPKPPGSVQLANGQAVRGVFDLADFPYVYPQEPLAHPESKAIMAKNRIPQRIQKLSGTEITLVGSFLPLEEENGIVREGLITNGARTSGFAPNITEWLYIPDMAMGCELFDLSTDHHSLVSGTFKIQMEVEEGHMVGLYRLEDVRFHKLIPIDMTRITNAKALKQRYTIYYPVNEADHRKPFTGTVTELDDLGQPVREVELVGGIPLREKIFPRQSASAK